jgi:geranylgeranyl pyrophosphate synthase
MVSALDFGISEELERVEKKIAESLQSEEELLTEIATYVVGSGGKRIRPALTLLAFYAAGGKDPSDAIEVASALELIHNATLIHDDINDGGILRRGMVAAHKKYGVHASLVTGDFLFTRGFEIGGKFSDRIVGVTARACVGLAEGEIKQQKNLRNLGLEPGDYLDIITRKTAMPMQTGSEVGAILGGGNEEQIRTLAEYGLNLGICFQIVDDILDVIGTEEILGKPIGTDIREGILTLVPIYALSNGASEERQRLRTILQKESKNDSDVETAIQILKESGAIEEAREEASKYSRSAKACLSAPIVEEYRERLLNLADFVLDRSY